MSVMTREEILRRLESPPEDVCALVLTPLAYDEGTGEPQDIDEDSIDLRLGTRFLLPRVHHAECLRYPTDERENYFEAVEAAEIRSDEYITIPAHGTVLGSTLEYLKLPYDLSGQVLTRSSLARRFITIATAPWIHPLYRGCLTLEIANASNTAIKLRPKAPIGQLVLFKLDDVSRPKSDRIESKYFGPTYAELPM
ncbi:MAG: dCTP deaminase [Phycisphaerales bacterium]|nr:MAG: dCTP deaminase [Phycisphaerales bacterium]